MKRGKKGNGYSTGGQHQIDSLQLSLYNNGEVDGDTVSVLLNGT